MGKNKKLSQKCKNDKIQFDHNSNCGQTQEMGRRAEQRS